MYCRYCGKELPDKAQFCMNCGAAQGGQRTEASPKKSKTPIVIICVLAVLVVAMIAVVLAVLASGGEKSQQEDFRMTEPAVVTVPTQTPAPSLPRDGWYQEDGKKYYYDDGVLLTGLQELDHDLYYFYEDGTLAVNTTIDFGDNSLEFDGKGRMVGVTFATIPNTWSSESFSFGNGGQAAILELETEVEKCRSMTLYLEASGLYGANVSGKWKLHIRSHGTWEYVQDIHFTQPDGSFTIRFDTPKDFDAITVYPTVQGNATYNIYYNIYDVYCRQ